MKKKLLLIVPMFLLVLSSNAQKTWDFSNAAVFDKSTTGYSATTDADGLSVVPGASVSGFAKLGTITFSSPSKEFTDGFAGRTYAIVQKSTVSGSKPTAKYFTFPVTAGSGSVKVWYAGGSTGRTVFVSDGTNLLTNGTSPNVASGSTGYWYTATYTASNNRDIYVYTSNDLWIFKIEWIPDTLGVDDFKADSSANVYSNGSQVFVSNVKSNTAVSVYSVTGALVKTLETSSDTSFDLASGVWIVKAKSAEGEKSVKVLVK